MTLNGEHQFYWGRVVVPGYGEALVFINIEALPALLDAEEIHVDATFFSAPRGFYQLASTHAISFGAVRSSYSLILSKLLLCLCHLLFYILRLLMSDAF